MESKPLENIECPVHPDRQYRYICLSPNCAIEPKSCIICIKDQHQSCEYEKIVEIHDFLNRVVIQNRQYSGTLAVRDYIKDYIDVAQIETLSKLKRKRNFLARLLESYQEPPLKYLTEDQIQAVYDNYIWKYDNDNDEIKFYNAAALNQKVIRSSIQLYKKEFQRQLNKFMSAVNKINMNFKLLEPNHFYYESEHLSIEQTTNGVHIYNISTSTDILFAAIYKFPLKKNLFKVTITGLNMADKFLNIGIISESYFNTIKNKKQTSEIYNKLEGTISYSGNGFNKMKLLKGKLSHHFIDRVYWLKYDDKEKDVFIYDDQNFRAKNLSILDNTDYYFYVALKSLESSCHIVSEPI